MAREDKMIEAKREKSAKQKEAVINAVERLKRGGNTITLEAVKREARVSRSFIYKNKDMFDLVNENRTFETKKYNPKKSSYSNRRNTIDMLKDQVNSSNIIIAQLREEIAELKKESYKEKYEDAMVQISQLELENRSLLTKLNDYHKKEEVSRFPELAAKIAKKNQS